MKPESTRGPHPSFFLPHRALSREATAGAGGCDGRAAAAGKGGDGRFDREIEGRAVHGACRGQFSPPQDRPGSLLRRADRVPLLAGDSTGTVGISCRSSPNPSARSPSRPPSSPAPHCPTVTPTSARATASGMTGAQDGATRSMGRRIPMPSTRRSPRPAVSDAGRPGARPGTPVLAHMQSRDFLPALGIPRNTKRASEVGPGAGEPARRAPRGPGEPAAGGLSLGRGGDSRGDGPVTQSRRGGEPPGEWATISGHGTLG